MNATFLADRAMPWQATDDLQSSPVLVYGSMDRAGAKRMTGFHSTPRITKSADGPRRDSRGPLGEAPRRKMRRGWAFVPLGLGLVSTILLAPPSAVAETPFAAPPLADPGQPETSLLSLGDIMGKTQWRHIKLWYAIKSRNWDLMAYELGHLRDTFEAAVIHYRNIPIEYIVAVDKPLVALEGAITSKDGVSSEQGFRDLTAACNTCHQAAQIGFVFIQTPTSSPFSNQQFAPRKK